MIDRDLGLGLGLGRDRLFGGISVSAEIVNFSAENRDRFKRRKNITFLLFRQFTIEIFLPHNFFHNLHFFGMKIENLLKVVFEMEDCARYIKRLRGCVNIGNF